MTNFEKLQSAVVSGNVVEIVAKLIAHALDSRASDIHIEPETKTVRTRIRIDGVLHEVVEYSHNMHPAIVSRMKIMSNLKIDEQRLPQDGRAQVMTEDGRRMDLRVSTLPTVNGEKIVMRIQDKNKKIPSFEILGLSGRNLTVLRASLNAPNGIILVTGPTGSGKTTTLYSALEQINAPEVNIMTIEDPVEYQMEGLNQSQVHTDIGFTFTTGLRTALRQDPDIIMVGEIRDEETIEIAIRAALTGHLVFSTIHTNSAVSTVTRIIDMGVKPYLIAAALNTVQAQRLVRRLCPKCREAYTPSETELADITGFMQGISEQVIAQIPKPWMMYKGRGCADCGNSGYYGRIGIYEVVEFDHDISEAISSGASEDEIQALALRQGAMTLAQDGLLKALAGETTLQEVIEVARMH